MNKFVRDHIIQIHYKYLSKNHKIYLPPLDRFLRSYFNQNKSIGSSERSIISQKIYTMIRYVLIQLQVNLIITSGSIIYYFRYQYLLSYMTKTNPFKMSDQPLNKLSKNTNSQQTSLNEDKIPKKQQQLIEDKLQLLHKNQIYSIIDNQKLPKWLRTSSNKLMFKQLSLSLLDENDFIHDKKTIRDGKQIFQLGNQDQASKIMQIMNTRAPLTLRLNPLKITPDKFQKTLAQMEKQFKIRLHKTQYAPYGYKILAPKNVNLLQTQSFLRGQFQIQDQGSQLTAMNVKCKPGDLVLDFCGGSGGKSLAIAHLLSNKGQIFVHEPRQVALQKARKRFNRAGIQNVQFHSNQDSLQKILLKKADWIIIDAPCTGVGTLRRNPDIKLRFTQEYLKRNTILQEQIFARTLKYLNKNGRIVYITCSLLKQQNQDQIKKFTSLHDLQVQNRQIMKIQPQKDGMDGFFATVLKRK